MYYKSEIHVIDLVSVHHNITAVQEIYNRERETDLRNLNGGIVWRMK